MSGISARRSNPPWIHLLAWFLGVGAVLALTFAGSVGAEAQPEQAGDPEAGAEVYRQQCAMCHGDDGSGMMGMHPALRGAVDRLSVEGVEVTVRKGRATRPPMPAFEDRLSQSQIEDVVAYVGTLPDGPRNFGPDSGDGMAGRTMDGMTGDGMGGWMFLLVILVVALLAGTVGFLLGRGR